MTRYKNMFYDERQDRMVSVDLNLDDIIIEPEESRDSGGSQAEDYDIKYGYESSKGYVTPAYVGTPLMYELRTSGLLSDSEVQRKIITDPELTYGNRNTRDAFQILFQNYIYTSVQDPSRARGSSRFWYNVSIGTVATYNKVSRGLDLRQFLLKRNGTKQGISGSYSVLPNVFSGGETCHGNMQGVNRWQESTGRNSTHPETLAKVYEYFKGGVGNHDLTSSNYISGIPIRDLLGIIEEYRDNYINNIEHEGVRLAMLTYANVYIREIREENSLGSTVSLNTNQLASIMEHSPSYYIEDYL